MVWSSDLRTNHDYRFGTSTSKGVTARQAPQTEKCRAQLSIAPLPEGSTIGPYRTGSAGETRWGRNFTPGLYPILMTDGLPADFEVLYVALLVAVYRAD
jgi:hypothetical protein